MIGIFYIDINIHGAVVVCGDIGTRQYYGYTKSQAKKMYLNERKGKIFHNQPEKKRSDNNAE